MSDIKAIIFDMDGTLVDNSPYHREAWKIFCEKYNLSRYTELDGLFGQTNDFLLPYFFEKELNQQEIEEYANEKEAIYRDIYAPKIEPIDGLFGFLEKLKAKPLKLAVATSANKDNVDFVLNKIKVQQYFQCVVDESYVSKGKPDPEIFLVCANKLGVAPNECVVFEDSVYGVEAACKAGMKVIGLETTVKAELLKKADFVIHDYTQVSIEKIIGQN